MADIEGFTDEIMQELNRYTGEVAGKAKQATDEIANGTVERLKADSKELFEQHSGKYAKGWRQKTTYEDNLQKRDTVYNTDPHLPHLLEKGHAKRGGGRVEGRKHIATAEEEASQKLDDRIRELLSDG